MSKKAETVFAVKGRGFPQAWVKVKTEEPEAMKARALKLYRERYKPETDGRPKGSKTFEAEVVTDYPEPRAAGVTLDHPGVYTHHIGFDDPPMPERPKKEEAKKGNAVAAA